MEKLTTTALTPKYNSLRLPANPTFFGRENILDEIERFLQPSNPHNSFSSVLLHGLGGMGKTQTALKYAHSQVDVVDGVFWVLAENDTALANAYSDLATNVLKLPVADSSRRTEHRVAVLDWFQKTGT